MLLFNFSSLEPHHPCCNQEPISIAATLISISGLLRMGITAFCKDAGVPLNNIFLHALRFPTFSQESRKQSHFHSLWQLIRGRIFDKLIHIDKFSRIRNNVWHPWNLSHAYSCGLCYYKFLNLINLLVPKTFCSQIYVISPWGMLGYDSHYRSIIVSKLTSAETTSGHCCLAFQQDLLRLQWVYFSWKWQFSEVGTIRTTWLTWVLSNVFIQIAWVSVFSNQCPNFSPKKSSKAMNSTIT